MGYCTNVHPGTTLAEVLANLETSVAAVKQHLGERGPIPVGPFPVGLWLSETAVQQLQSAALQTQLRECFDRHQFLPRSLNGFPCGDFHQAVVKHAVYQPTWADPQRLRYTEQLAELQATWLGPGQRGTISTVPLGWPQPSWTESMFSAAAANLLAYAQFAARLHDQTGVEIRLCLEPEPGCLWSTSPDLVDFFQRRLLADAGHEHLVRRFLGVCHDVCHSAVMFEPQATAIANYVSAGIPIFKVQISAALVAPLAAADTAGISQMLEHLRRYAEPRYLHQTMIGGERFFEDLPAALDWQASQAGQSAPWAQEWRVHFHVPIFASELPGGLRTTQASIRECLLALKQIAGFDLAGWQRGDWDMEVETYAWQVLPEDLRGESLPLGIARELAWIDSLMLGELFDQ